MIVSKIQLRLKKEWGRVESSSPICFNLIPNELAWTIDATDIGVTLEPGSKKLGLLMYADDIVLFANTAYQLQDLVDICNTWANRYSLKINLHKSVVVDYSARPTKLDVVIEGKQLEQVTQYRYLGKVIGTTRVGAAHAKAALERVRSAGRATRVILNSVKCMPIIKRSIIAEACITTVATYASECAQHEWNGASLKCAEIERVRLARMILHAPAGIARETSMLDMGWITLANHMRTRLLRFRKRVYNMNDQLAVIMRDINAKELLPWEKRCKDTLTLLNLKEYQDNTKLQTTDTKEWQSIVAVAARELNLEESLHRLKNERKNYKTILPTYGRRS
ncbi:unnamed protein product [Blepharisma stoltei]|uniref:Reverse transcriptase domain-containing protein n=1 Tax=Blepharisma stoltei TaxID=1481888 RepID=A0AAU9J615_9CILI|nr:unnamed protein product [Blepharisma stoltei]